MAAFKVGCSALANVNNKRNLIAKDQPPKGPPACSTQAMLQVQYLTATLLVASVLGALPAYADSGVLLAGQTLSQVCS